MDKKTRQRETETYPASLPSRITTLGKIPIHPLLVPFPIVFITLALLTDILYWATANPMWAQNSVWLLTGALITGGLAGAVGLVDFIAIKQARRRAGKIHVIAGGALMALTLTNLLLRLRECEEFIVPAGLALSGASVVLMKLSAWYGYKLVYRYRIGVAGPPAEDCGDDAHKGA